MMDEQAYFEQFVGDEPVFDIDAIMQRFVAAAKLIMDQYEEDANALATE